MKSELIHIRLKDFFKNLEKAVNEIPDEGIKSRLNTTSVSLQNCQRQYEEHFVNFKKYLQEDYSKKSNRSNINEPRHPIHSEKLQDVLNRFSTHNHEYKRLLQNLTNIGIKIPIVPSNLNYMEARN